MIKSFFKYVLESYKQHFSSKIHVVSSSTFDFLCIDIQEPFPISAVNGEKYFILVFDDFSHFQWIYFIHSKDQAMFIFLKFKSMVECQYDTHIKVVQCDGANEFIQLGKLLSNLGINFRHTCLNYSYKIAWLRVTIEELWTLVSHFFLGMVFLRHIEHML